MFCHIWCLWNRNCYHIIFSMIWKEFVIFCHIWTEFGTAMELCRSDHLRPWTPARVSASPFLRGNSSSNGSFMTEYQRLDARQVPQVGRLSCWKLKAKKNNKLYLSFPCVLTCVFINLKKDEFIVWNTKWSTIRYATSTHATVEAIALAFPWRESITRCHDPCRRRGDGAQLKIYRLKLV